MVMTIVGEVPEASPLQWSNSQPEASDAVIVTWVLLSY